MRPSKFISLFEVAQLHSENGRLNAIHPCVPANHGVVIFLDLAVISQDANFLLQIGVIGNHRAGLSECAEILPRIEAKAAHVTERTRPSSLVFGSMCLGGILDH